MQLSPRLQKIASLVPPCSVLADIGTDHGYIPLFCLENGKAKNVIATDINEKPLKRAETNIKSHGFSSFADFRLCNGLDALSEGEADVIVIAGMGGPLICDILKNGKDAAKQAELLTVLTHYGTVEDFDRVMASVQAEWQRALNEMTAQYNAIADQKLTPDELSMVNLKQLKTNTKRE